MIEKFIFLQHGGGYIPSRPISSGISLTPGIIIVTILIILLIVMWFIFSKKRKI